MKRKPIIFLFVVALVAVAAWFTYHRLMDSRETILDNRYYKTELDSIRTIRSSLKRKQVGKKELKATFLKQITHKVFPYWYGTKWDYNGTTEMPHKGSIACGYFVTTTLRDMGVPINRVKMAQCASEEMIRSLVTKQYIYHLPGIPLREFEKRWRATVTAYM